MPADGTFAAIAAAKISAPFPRQRQRIKDYIRSQQKQGPSALFV
jgi:hypothetical protein